MLIDLSRFGPLTIDPSQYLTTLAVRVDVPRGKRMCGVFAGHHQDFSKDEENKLVPCIEDEDESPVFLLDRSESQVTDHCMARWTYAAIGWESGVYVEHPYVWELTLQELSGNEPGDPPHWHVSFNQLHGIHLTLILPEYKPGALLRGDYKAIIPAKSGFMKVSG
jgi:hypothetical protein